MSLAEYARGRFLSSALAGRIRTLDEGVCIRWNRVLRYPGLLRTMRVVSRLGDGIFWYVLMAGLPIVAPGGLLPAAQMIGSGLVSHVAYRILKGGTLRPRPYQVLDSIAPGASPLDQFSFPSGHTLHAVAFTLIVCTYYPLLAFVLVPFTLLTAASRIALGLHYPSDVLAGACLGAAIASASFLLF